MSWNQLERIHSSQNPLFKAARLSRREKLAKKNALMLLEGRRLIDLALPAGEMIVLFYRDDEQGQRCYESLSATHKLEDRDGRRLSLPLFAELAQTEHSQGVIGLFRTLPVPDLTDAYPERSRVLILENIRDPGNLGNLTRTAEALGFRDILFLGDAVSPWNAKSLRASMGTALYISYRRARELSEILPQLKALDLITADMQGERLSKFQPENAARGFALLLGNEAHGVSTEARELCRYLISVDMQGKAESLNVGNAASILAYELSRIYGFFS